MDSVDGSDLNPDLDDAAELDEDDLSPRVRKFLESIAQRDDDGRTPADRRRMVDRERRVTRFAWTCEELNVAFGDLRADEETIGLLVDHGVRSTLFEIHAQAAALLAKLDQDGTAE
jgi:hypothetical protein